MLTCVRLFVTPWTVAHQAPLSMECSSQGYCNGLLFPVPADLPNPGIKLESPALHADSFPSEPSLLPRDRTGYSNMVLKYENLNGAGKTIMTYL